MSNQMKRRYKVLIIDDSPADLLWAERILDKEKFVTLTAAEGKTGLALAGEKRPDVIVLDCILPDLSGIEVCKILKTDERTRQIPVIFLTVVEDGLNLLKCYEVGADFYLVKPVKARELILAIRTVIKEKRDE